MNIITSFNINEVFSRIKIKKPIKFNNKIILNLYDGYQDCLLFQSPIMYLPYDYIHNDNAIKCIDLCEYNDNKFLSFIIILFKKILTKIENFNNTLFMNKNFFSNIVSNKKNEDLKMLRLREVYFSKINVYDNNNNLININKIVKETKIKCILMIKNVWINDNNYGFNIELLQIQNKDFINNNNLFKNSDDSWTNITIENDLDKPMPPPPPPPPPPMLPPPPPNNSNNFNSNINNLIKTRKNNNKNNTKSNTNNIPTMADVLNQLKSGQIKLRKTNFKNIKEENNVTCEMEEVLKRRISLVDGN